MFIVLPLLTLLVSLTLGAIIVERLSFKHRKFEWLFFIMPIGIITFTLINFLGCVLFSFPNGIIIASTLIAIFEIFYGIKNPEKLLENLNNLKFLLYERHLILLLLGFGSLLTILFHTHILLNINGDLYTGDSSYGDLPFHLSVISHIAFTSTFPPQNPFFAHQPLVYPYLINFFSAILVYEGWSLRNSIIIPGFILSISLIGLLYGFAFEILKNKAKASLTVIIFLLNGGVGFYFFLKDHSFSLFSIIQYLLNPTSIKEYTHLWEQNIQWVNFLSRMIVPERSLLFGIPAGIIILRLLFFRDEREIKFFDLFLISLLLSFLPILHTHTALALVVILPILAVSQIRKHSWKTTLRNYFVILLLSIPMSIIHIPTFINYLGESPNFIRLHIGWMQKNTESFWEFWFKNTYLLIPLTAVTLLIRNVINRQARMLQVCGLVLLILMNLVLFSPYDWDNVKFLFWIGLFFDISVASLLVYLFQKKHWLTKLTVFIITLSMILSGLLSIWREINVKYVLFSKEAVFVGEQLRKTTPKDTIFLTYKVHNSPVNNLAGRQILMGYPGLLWVHGINYQHRETDINDMFGGGEKVKQLFEKYRINYVVLEKVDSENLYINRAFFDHYPVIYRGTNYTVYKIL